MLVTEQSQTSALGPFRPWSVHWSVHWSEAARCCTSAWQALPHASVEGQQQGHIASGSCQHDAPSETSGASEQRGHGSLRHYHS